MRSSPQHSSHHWWTRPGNIADGIVLNIKSIYLGYTKIYIIQVYTGYILGIYTQKVYTWHIPGIWQFKKNIYSIYLAYTKSNLKLYLVYTWYMTIYKNIPGIYLVYSNSKEYTWNIPKIYMAYSNSKVYTWNIPRIYRYYTWHMTICRIWLDYTMKNIYGFVPYQSRTLIAKGYTWYMGLFRTSHVP